jgi:hypothetical protein
MLSDKIKKYFIILSPDFIANLLPKKLPNILDNAKGIASKNKTFPPKIKATRLPTFDITLKTFALAVASINLSFVKKNKLKVKKEPVPGPKKPS